MNKPKNLKLVKQRVCATCRHLKTDDAAWFCDRPEGPRWEEYDQPYCHVCDYWKAKYYASKGPQDPQEPLHWDESGNIGEIEYD